MELQDDGKVDFMFEKTQDVLQSLKKKIKDGSATNKGVQSETPDPSYQGYTLEKV